MATEPLLKEEVEEQEKPESAEVPAEGTSASENVAGDELKDEAPSPLDVDDPFATKEPEPLIDIAGKIPSSVLRKLVTPAEKAAEKVTGKAQKGVSLLGEAVTPEEAKAFLDRHELDVELPKKAVNINFIFH